MSEERGPYNLMEHGEDKPLGVPWWQRPDISQGKFARVRAIALNLASIVLATQTGQHIRSEANELKKLLGREE